MATVHIFQNKQTGNIVLCPFAFYKRLGGGSVASGALIHVSLDEFSRRGADIVASEFESFHTRDSSITSELYNEMTEAQQKKFLSEHSKVVVSKPFKDKPGVNIFAGPNNERYGRLDFPFDKDTFPAYILEALSKAG